MNSPIRLCFPVAMLCTVVLLCAVPATGQAQKTMSTGAGSNTRIDYPGYSLKLIFAERDGPYVAGIDVTIFDDNGNKVVDAFSAGPWFLADLAPHLQGGRQTQRGRRDGGSGDHISRPAEARLSHLVTAGRGVNRQTRCKHGDGPYLSFCGKYWRSAKKTGEAMNTEE